MMQINITDEGWGLQPSTVAAATAAFERAGQQVTAKQEAQADHRTMTQLHEHDIDRVAYRIALQEKLKRKLKSQHNKNKLHKHLGYSYITIAKIDVKTMNETQCLALLGVIEE